MYMCVEESWASVVKGRQTKGIQMDKSKKKRKERIDKEQRETKSECAVIRWQPGPGVLSRSKDTQSTVKIMVPCAKWNKSIGSARR